MLIATVLLDSILFYFVYNAHDVKTFAKASAVASFIVSAQLYFLPWILGSWFGCANTTGIFVANLLTGWTGIGHLIVLLCACLGCSNDSSNT
mmetsp:Transcript_37470/g.69048  ORF Transcript_37470/g.69048 Transcript_37470/m.69048 type:complete len:92 (-) Transcript_37470:293-568(-)